MPHGNIVHVGPEELQNWIQVQEDNLCFQSLNYKLIMRSYKQEEVMIFFMEVHEATSHLIVSRGPFKISRIRLFGMESVIYGSRFAVDDWKPRLRGGVILSQRGWDHIRGRPYPTTQWNVSNPQYHMKNVRERMLFVASCRNTISLSASGVFWCLFQRGG